MIKFNRDILKNKIIDIHTHSVGIEMNHFRTGTYPITQNILDLSNIILSNGIDFAVTFPMPTTVYYNYNLIYNENRFEPSGYSDYPYQYENNALYNLILQMKIQNLIPFVSVSVQEKVKEQIKGIYSLHEKFGVYGIKYHSNTERLSIDNSRFEPFAKLAHEMNIPILVHSEFSQYSHPDNILRFASKHPNVRICIAHCVRFHKNVLERINRDFENIYVDTAPLVRLCKIAQNTQQQSNSLLALDFKVPLNALQEFIEFIPKKVLWGTDVPWHHFVNDENVVTYEDEASLIKSIDIVLREQVIKNQIRFLFGND